MKRLSLVLALLGSMVLQAQTVDVTPSTTLGLHIRSQAVSASSDVRNFYGPSGYEAVWTRDGRPTAQALAAIALLQSAATKALDPADYEGGQWSARIANLRGDAALARFDVSLTSAVMRYASDLRIGRVNPRELSFDLDVTSRRLYLPALVARVATAQNVTAVFDEIEPRHPEYRQLLNALDRYRAIASTSATETPLPAVRRLEPGQEYEAVERLAARLRSYGDLSADASVASLYEGAVVDGVRSFQSRHGLNADGIIGAATFAQLNTPIARRVEQIEWAVERWRWIPDVNDAQTIVVNIPEFRLRARDPESGEELSMRVVVGRSRNSETPIFGGALKNVVLRPYWNVPPRIQRNEITPKIERDGGYLARNGYEVVDSSGKSLGSHADAETLRGIRNGSLRVRQKPGTSNALGLAKFVFPNDNNIYLHSTPQQELFGRARRDFSHGCIRVEDPVALAEWVLRHNGDWTKEKIVAAMNGKRDDLYIRVARPVEVVLVYATAAADANGQVRFFDDIYAHDVQLARVLEPKSNGAGVVLAAK